MTKNSDVLMHHGVKGMHWGIRRYEPYPSGHKGGKEVGEAAKISKSKSKKTSSSNQNTVSEGSSANKISAGKSKKGKTSKIASVAGGIAGAAALTAGGVVVANRISKSKSKKTSSSSQNTVSEGSSIQNTVSEGVWKRNKKQGKDKAPTSSAEQIAKGVDSITKETTRVGNRIIDRVESRARQKNNVNRAKGKSDEELRRTVNRIRLEREYNSLTSPEISKGYSTARNILETIGSISTIGLAGVGIYATIKNLK